ncbi:MAG: MerR family transcriptional regulator [Erythrobacter sp.]
MPADFDDGKEAGALRTIGEVSDALDIKPHVLRYWEQQFPMLSPLKRSGGRRYYRSGDIAVVEAINQLVNVDGYTLKGAKAALKAADRRSDDRRKGERREGGETQESPADARFAGRPPEEALALSEAIPQLKAVRAKLAAIVEG